MWFKKPSSPHQTALAMIGARAGDRVLIAGAGHPALAAELGRVTGLNGRALVVDDDPATAGIIETAAAEAGALVEFVQGTPDNVAPDSDAWHVAVMMMPLSILSEENRTRYARRLMDLLGPGGRLVILEGSKPPRTFGRSSALSALPASDVLKLLELAGGRARRLLAEVDGVSYYEAQKTRQTS